MNYKASLAKFLAPGEFDNFPNGEVGFLLVGVGTDIIPEWKSLEDANVASKNHTHLYAGSTSAGGPANEARKLYLGDGIFRCSTDTIVDDLNLNIDALNANGLFIYGDDGQAGRWMEKGLVFQLSSQNEPIPGTSGHHLFQLWSSFDNRLGVRWRNGTESWSDIETIISSAVTNNDKGKLLRYNNSGLFDWVSPSDHTHPYLPLSGGVMYSTAYNTDTPGVQRYDSQGVYSKAPVSTELIENYGRYLGVAYGTITTSNPSIIVIETGITTNANLPSSETFFQIHVSGLAMSNKGKTLDVRIGLSIKTNGSLNTGSSGKTGWASFGSLIPSKVQHAVVSNKHVVVLVVPSDTYRINVDAFCDYASVRDSNWVSNINNSIIRGWELADSTSATLADLNKVTPAVTSHEHALTDITSGFPNAGVMISTGNTSQPTYKAGSADKQFLKYSVSNNVESYSFATITANDIPNIESLNASAGAAGKLLVSKSSGAEWLPAGANGNFLKQTASGPAYTAITSADISDLNTTIAAALPSAYSDAAEPLGAVASPGLSNAYSRGDHIHPLPFMVPTAERFFKPIKIGLTGAVTAEAVELDGTNDVILNVTRIDPYLLDITLPVALGGTGRTTLDAYKLLVGNGTSAVAFVENGTNSSYFLKTGAGNAAPSFAAVTWSDISSKPTSFTPSSHTHGVSDVKSDSGVAQAILITHPTKTASESVGTTAGSVGQVPYQKATGNNAEIGWLTPRLRDVRAYYGIAGSSPSSITHTAGHDTLFYTVENPVIPSGQDSYTCEVTVPTPTVEGDVIELHLISQAAAGIKGYLKIATNGILYKKDGALVSSSSSNILSVAHGQYITLRAIAITSSNRNSSIFTWLAKIVSEASLN